MPPHPKPEAVAHIWEWEKLYALAKRSGDLVPVGRGGERRAIGLANPGLGGRAYISPTLWAAVQYLGPRENAPEHRHAQNAFRFVLEGEGVWTVVDGDPIHMSRGDLLLTPGWQFHGHQNISDKPMAWLDGLDIPFSQQMDVGFFEFGADQVSNLETPEISRGERLWAHPGLRPLSGLEDTVSSPIGAYRWENTDRALREQLALEDEGYSVTGQSLGTRHCGSQIQQQVGMLCPPSGVNFTVCGRGHKHCPGAMLDLRYFRSLTERGRLTSTVRDMT
jgi:gentisate 1,2-dioxygenase